MAINTTNSRDRVDRTDNSLLWTILAIVVTALLAYGAYALNRSGNYNFFGERTARQNTSVIVSQ